MIFFTKRQEQNMTNIWIGGLHLLGQYFVLQATAVTQVYTNILGTEVAEYTIPQAAQALSYDAVRA